MNNIKLIDDVVASLKKADGIFGDLEITINDPLNVRFKLICERSPSGLTTLNIARLEKEMKEKMRKINGLALQISSLELSSTDPYCFVSGKGKNVILSYSFHLTGSPSVDRVIPVPGYDYLKNQLENSVSRFGIDIVKGKESYR